MDLRKVERDDLIECHLTARCPSGADPEEAATEVYRAAAAVLARDGVRVLQEKIYGPTSHRPQILAVRHRQLDHAGVDAGTPYSFIEGRHRAGELRGIQVFGIVPRPGCGVEVATVRSRDGVAGAEVIAPRYRHLFLSSIRGVKSDASLADDPPVQAARMFARAEAALQERRFSFTHVARTWIYMKDILEWYGDFNAVRTAFYRERGIDGAVGGQAFPASTGIQGTSDGEACVMDLCAVDAAPGSGVEVRPVLASARQRAAFAYGSSFSRAVVISRGPRRSLLVSGTASLDASGRTLHVGDRAAQIHETVGCVAALVEGEGGSLADVCSATVFGKDAETLRLFETMMERRELPRFPHVAMVADVCRPELLVEIEALAAITVHGEESS